MSQPKLYETASGEMVTAREWIRRAYARMAAEECLHGVPAGMVGRKPGLVGANCPGCAEINQQYARPVGRRFA